MFLLFFQTAGYYTERNIVEKEKEEILELDIIVANYDSSPIERKIIEVKSGGWGFEDIFKLYGQMNYLKFSEGLFIVRENKNVRNFDLFKAKSNQINIRLEKVDNLKNSKKLLSDLIIHKNDNSEEDITIWRFSYWLERLFLKRLKNQVKSNPHIKSFSVLEDYYFNMHCNIFFIENRAERIQILCENFSKHPHISAVLGNELINNTFDKECNLLPSKIFKDTFIDCKYNDIQISTFIEHSARLNILKNLIDYELYKKCGDKNKIESNFTLINNDKEYKIPYTLPSFFAERLNSISQQKYFHKYPIFWQWFIGVFGGFILKDHENREYEILSQKTGIPLDEIDNALKAYQIIFPLTNGWFTNYSSNIMQLKLFPVPFAGIGANYRRLIYTETKKFKDLKFDKEDTLNTLIKWNNLTAEILQKN